MPGILPAAFRPGQPNYPQPGDPATTTKPHTVLITIRDYEPDSQGHLNEEPYAAVGSQAWPSSNQPAPGEILPFQPPNSSAFTPLTNASHSLAVKVTTGPSGRLLLRTARPPPGNSATATQLSFAPLKVLIRQASSSGVDAIFVSTP